MSTLSDRSISVPSIVEHYSDEELNSRYHCKEDYQNAVKKYGIIFKVLSFSDIDDPNLLKQYAREFIKDYYYDGVLSFNIKAVDLHLLGYDKDRFVSGERVPVEFIDTEDTPVTKTLSCISAQYDLLKPENSSFKIGIPDVSSNVKYRKSLTKKSSGRTQSGKEEDAKGPLESLYGAIDEQLHAYGIDIGDIDLDDYHLFFPVWTPT